MLESRICPKPMVTERSHLLLDLYRHYDNRHLLVAGGLMDQPAAYLQAMQIIAGAVTCDATKS